MYRYIIYNILFGYIYIYIYIYSLRSLRCINWMRRVARTPPTRTCKGSLIIEQQIDYGNNIDEKKHLQNPRHVDSEPACTVFVLHIIKKSLTERVNGFKIVRFEPLGSHRCSALVVLFASALLAELFEPHCGHIWINALCFSISALTTDTCIVEKSPKPSPLILNTPYILA